MNTPSINEIIKLWRFENAGPFKKGLREVPLFELIKTLISYGYAEDDFKDSFKKTVADVCTYSEDKKSKEYKKWRQGFIFALEVAIHEHCGDKSIIKHATEEELVKIQKSIPAVTEYKKQAQTAIEAPKEESVDRVAPELDTSIYKDLPKPVVLINEDLIKLIGPKDE